MMRIALVANPRSRSCDPDRCAERLRELEAHVEAFAIDAMEPAIASEPRGRCATRLSITGFCDAVATATWKA